MTARQAGIAGFCAGAIVGAIVAFASSAHDSLEPAPQPQPFTVHYAAGLARR